MILVGIVAIYRVLNSQLWEKEIIVLTLYLPCSDAPLACNCQSSARHQGSSMAALMNGSTQAAPCLALLWKPRIMPRLQAIFCQLGVRRWHIGGHLLHIEVCYQLCYAMFSAITRTLPSYPSISLLHHRPLLLQCLTGNTIVFDSRVGLPSLSCLLTLPHAPKSPFLLISNCSFLPPTQ